VNGNHLVGLSHKELVAVMGDLPQQVYLVCARQMQSNDAKLQEAEYAESSLSVTGPAPDRLVKSKSEQTLNSTTDMAALDPNKSKSKSLDSLSLFGTWSSEPLEVELIKADKGLGFSILDYPVNILSPKPLRLSKFNHDTYNYWN